MKFAMVTLSILCVGQSFMLGRIATMTGQAFHAQHEVNRAMDNRMLSIERAYKRYGVYEPCCRGVTVERDI
jgi:hypothetical protein